MNSSEFYQTAIPKLCSDNLDLKGLWDSHPCLLTGKIISLSESFYLSDIQTFACTNPRCRNNKRVIRHVGFDQLEQISELGPEESKPEVFVTSVSKSKTTIKCHNCREEISELYPFRSNLEFKLAKLKVEDSCFAIDLLLVGAKNCAKVNLSNNLNLIGYPKLTAEIPHQLKFIAPKLKNHYFEVFGVDNETRNVNYHSNLIRDALNWLTNNICHDLKFPLLVILCQIIGAYNNLNFNICLPGIDAAIIMKISKLLNLIFKDSFVIGSMKSNIITSKSAKQKGLEIKEEIYANLVNIITENSSKIGDDSKSFIFTKFIPNDQMAVIPVDLSLGEEADILLKPILEFPQFELPKSNEPVNLSSVCVKSLQSHFLAIRSSTKNLPLKFNLNFLTKLAQISAISNYKQEADSDDAEFAIMIHEKIVNSSVQKDYDDDFDYRNNIMSPSVSFELGNDFPCNNKIKDHYGIH